MYAAELPNATDEQKKARVTRACQMSFPPACKKLVEDGTKLPMLDADAAKMREKLCADGVKKACAAKK